MPKSHLRLATHEDDPVLRKMLRNPMPGSISLSYEREPDYFITAGMEGSLSQTVVNEDLSSGLFLGMGTRVIRRMYFNGEVQELGYFGHLRVDLQRSWGLSLGREVARSFGKMQELHADGRAPFYLVSVIADNQPARRLLTSGLPGLPQAKAFTRMFTYAVSPRRRLKEIPLPGGLELQRGTPEHIAEIVACLQRNGWLKQFAPFWSSENIFTPIQTPNLGPEDFFVAVRGSRVLGCLALWDQTPFKQTVVRSYSGGVGLWRPVINLLAGLIDLPHMPEVDSGFPYCYASHLAIDEDDPSIFESLVRAIYNETNRRGFNYFMIGLAEAHPLRPLFTRKYLHVIYPSQIYLMAWEDGLARMAQVDGRVPGLEIAIL